MKRKANQLISLLLALCMVLSLLPGAVLAEEVASGTCGDNLTWELDEDGTLTIHGTGSMKDYSSSEPWYNYRQRIETVIIVDGVTSIGGRAFYDCINLTSVDIPNSITSIGKSAFEDCRSLTSVTIPNSVNSIGMYAFGDCSGLTSVSIPNGVTSIEVGVFAGCSGLTNVTIPGSVTSIKDAAFAECSSLSSVTIPNGVITIGDSVFSVCSSLTNINVTSGNPAYSSIDGVLFNANQTLLHTYPAGRSSLSYRIPDSVTSIRAFAFESCKSLTSVTIPNSMTSIGHDAFYGCRSLISVTIPDSVTSIEDYAFEGCSSLADLTIPNSVTTIGKCSFGGCTSLTSVIIPNSVTSINDSAFHRCTSLTSVTIPNSVTSIGQRAFEDCSNLVSVTIPGSVAHIDWYTFKDCSGLTSVTISEGVTSIKYEAFRRCTSLTSVTIPNSVTSIGQNAFSECTSLASVTIPNSVTSIGQAAFSGCSSLTNMTIPNGVTSIVYLAFKDCSSLTSVTIPSSVTSIGQAAFSGCSSLTDVYYSGSETDWASISIDSFDDYYLRKATIHYNSTGPGVTNPNPPDKESKVTFSNGNLQITLGSEELVQATVSYRVLQASEVTWTSSREDIVSIVPGKVASSLAGGDTWAFATIQGRGLGTATVTCSTSTGLSNSFTVDVQPVLSKIILTGTALLNENSTGEVGAYMTFGTLLTDRAWTWTSSNPEVVAFDKKGLSSVSRSTGAKYDAIQIFARKGGAARITCTLSDGTTQSFSVRVLNKKEQKLQKAAEDWLRSYNDYINALETGLQAQGNTVDSKELDKLLEQLGQKLEEEYGIKVAVNERELEASKRIYVYKALLKMLADETSNELAFKNISVKDISSIGSDIVKAVMNGIRNDTYQYRDGKVTVELSIINGYDAKFGTATYKDGQTTIRNIVISSTPNTVQKITQEYTLQLLELDEKIVQQACKQVYKELSNVLFNGKSLSDMTKSTIASKITPHVDKLREAGFGDVLDIITTSYDFYQYVKKIIDGDFSDIGDYLTGTKDIEFKSTKIENYLANKAFEGLQKGKKKLTELVTGTSGSTLTEMIRNSTMFNCPVNVEVYDGSGKQIGYVGDDDIWYDENLIYIERDGDTKTIYSFGAALSFQLTGTDDGTLNCTFEDFSDGEATGRINYYDIPLYQGKKVSAKVPDADSSGSVSVTDEAGALQSDDAIGATEYEDASVVIACGSSEVSGGSVYGSGQYVRGDAVKVQAVVRSGYAFLGWINSNEELMSISTVYEFVAKENMSLIALFAETGDEKPSDTTPTYTITVNTSSVENGSVPCVVYSLSSEAKAVYVAAALYDSNGKLRETVMNELTLQEGRNNVTLNFTIEPASSDCIKVFLLGQTDYTPLCDAISPLLSAG